MSGKPHFKEMWRRKEGCSEGETSPEAVCKLANKVKTPRKIAEGLAVSWEFVKIRVRSKVIRSGRAL